MMERGKEEARNNWAADAQSVCPTHAPAPTCTHALNSHTTTYYPYSFHISYTSTSPAVPPPCHIDSVLPAVPPHWPSFLPLPLLLAPHHHLSLVLLVVGFWAAPPAAGYWRRGRGCSGGRRCRPSTPWSVVVWSECLGVLCVWRGRV